MYRTLTNKELLLIAEERQNDPIYNELYSRLEKLVINKSNFNTSIKLDCPSCCELLRVDILTNINFGKDGSISPNTVVKLF